MFRSKNLHLEIAVCLILHSVFSLHQNPDSPKKRKVSLILIYLDTENFSVTTRVVKEGGVAAIFDSQTESFLSQKGQSTKPSEAEFC